MGKRSEFTDVVLEIANEAKSLQAAAAKADPVPLMREKLSRRDALTRMGHMTIQDLAQMAPEERATLVRELGTDAVLGVIRRSR